jgi:hypothetical protein
MTTPEQQPLFRVPRVAIVNKYDWISNFLLQILKLHMVLFKLEMIHLKKIWQKYAFLHSDRKL